MVEEEENEQELDPEELEKERLIEIYENLKQELDIKQQEIEDLKSCLEEKERENEELKELVKKVKADYENYKKRNDKKLEKKYFEAKKDTIKELLNVVDSFDQAINLRGESDQEFLKGVKNIRQLFLDKLNDLGLREVDYDRFDPQKHQAIAKVDVDGEDKSNQIIEVVRSGYVLDQEVIRPALVKVSE
ncbi:nucleotide exchange factor GrpE [archaeon SCG-AAA382B04]|nr:nucleotide exchange factor GrpE [archaeon SCG-AAA382B04]